MDITIRIECDGNKVEVTAEGKTILEVEGNGYWSSIEKGTMDVIEGYFRNVRARLCAEMR